MKFYLQTRQDGTITDAITYPYGDYKEYVADSLPVGVNGGWYKLEDGKIVEYQDLKPIDEKTEIQILKQENTELKQAIAELGVANEQDKIETQLAIAELATLIAGGNA